MDWLSIYFYIVGLIIPGQRLSLFEDLGDVLVELLWMRQHLFESTEVYGYPRLHGNGTFVFCKLELVVVFSSKVVGWLRVSNANKVDRG